MRSHFVRIIPKLCVLVISCDWWGKKTFFWPILYLRIFLVLGQNRLRYTASDGKQILDSYPCAASGARDSFPSKSKPSLCPLAGSLTQYKTRSRTELVVQCLFFLSENQQQNGYCPVHRRSEGLKNFVLHESETVITG